MRFKGTLAAFCVAGTVAGLVQGTAASAADVTGLTGTVQRAVVDVEHPAPGQGVEHREHVGHADEQVEATYLRTGDGELVQVPTSALEGVDTGATVTVRLGRAVRVASADPAARVEAGRAVLEHRVVAAPRQVKATSTAVRKVLPVTVTAPDAAADGTGAAQLRTLVGQVSSYYGHVTHDAITYTPLTPTAATVEPGVIASCNIALLEQRVRTRVAVPDDTTLLMHTPAVNCGFAGVAWIGTPDRRGLALWVNGTTDPMVTAHEIGHNLGLGHSSSAACSGADDSATLAGCSVIEYGDFFDVMGSNSYTVAGLHLGEMNAPQRDRLGGFAAGELVRVNATSATSTALTPIGSGGAAQALKFATGGATYYVELRAGGGYDADLYPGQYYGTTDSGASGWGNTPTGVTVRRLDRDVTGAQPRLLEPRATGAAFVLAAGQTFTTVDGAVKVTTAAVSDSSATVGVEPTAVTPPPTPTTPGNPKPPAAGGVPGAPTIKDARHGNKSVALDVSVADTGGSPLTGYRITTYADGKAIRTRTISTRSGRVSVTGLTAGRSYVFGVAARNANGHGPETRTGKIVALSAPNRVTGVKTALTGASLAVTWTKPSDGGSPVTEHVVKAYRDGKLVKTQRVTGTTATVAVTPGATWSVTVAAVNAVGTGPASTRVKVEVPAR